MLISSLDRSSSYVFFFNRLRLAKLTAVLLVDKSRTVGHADGHY